MRAHRRKLLPLFAVLTFALPGASAFAERSVCYQWSAFPNERFRLNIEKHSPLTDDKEELGHARQFAWSVHGKEVGGCGSSTMGTATGTVVTGRSGLATSGPTGSHLGLEVHFVRGTGGDSCRPITLDCTSTEQSPVPSTWTCFSRNEFDVFHGASTLVRVDPSTDLRCSVFEDGNATATVDTSVAASAMRAR